MSNNYIEKVDFPDFGYQAIIDFETWRVAVLKYCDDLIAENIVNFQRHMLTDEVFVLINGTCNLYSARTGEIPGHIEQVSMEKHKAYNVKKGVWHAHTLSEDAEVLIVENQNTGVENSPVFPLTDEMRKKIIALELLNKK
ncbi:MAG: hypothetical protein WBI17_00965 [Clostridiaceae bacterium]